MKRVKFMVRERGGPAPRTGYALGDFACHRDRYSWTFTHLPSGLSLGCVAWCPDKASALAELARLVRDGLPEYAQSALGRAPMLHSNK